MSFVLIAPEFVTAAAGDLTNLGSSISAANASAASATTQVLAAGADEVSARIAALFGGFGLEYQAISAQVAAYHQRFVQALSTGAGAYALVMAARNRVLGSRGPRESKYAQLPVAPMGFIETRYYVSMNVADKPGVLSAVAAEFAKREVSIAEVRQEGVVDEGGRRVGARIVVVTHLATDAALSETVDALDDLDVVQGVSSVIRLEGTGL